MGESERAGRHRGASLLASIWMLGALAACGGGGTSADASGAADSTSAADERIVSSGTASLAQPANTEGRLLASNCFQCHGTLGLGGFEKIRGSEASEVMEYLNKPASRDIMAAHTQGYTPEQLRKIVTYLRQ